MVRGSKKDSLPVERLESQLQRSLRPVQPDPRFVGHLQNRLSEPALLVIERRHNTALSMMLLAASLLGGFALIWLLRQNRREETPNGGGEPALGKPQFAL